MHAAVNDGGFGWKLAGIIADIGSAYHPLDRREVPSPENRDLDKASVTQVEDSIEKARELVT